MSTLMMMHEMSYRSMRLRLATMNRRIVLRQLHKETALWLIHEDAVGPEDGEGVAAEVDRLAQSR